MQMSVLNLSRVIISITNHFLASPSLYVFYLTALLTMTLMVVLRTSGGPVCALLCMQVLAVAALSQSLVLIPIQVIAINCFIGEFVVTYGLLPPQQL